MCEARDSTRSKRRARIIHLRLEIRCHALRVGHTSDRSVGDDAPRRQLDEIEVGGGKPRGEGQILRKVTNECEALLRAVWAGGSEVEPELDGQVSAAVSGRVVGI